MEGNLEDRCIATAWKLVTGWLQQPMFQWESSHSVWIRSHLESVWDLSGCLGANTCNWQSPPAIPNGHDAWLPGCGGSIDQLYVWDKATDADCELADDNRRSYIVFTMDEIARSSQNLLAIFRVCSGMKRTSDQTCWLA